jgi:DNA-binding LytR/AlgR family response regulator
LHSTFPSLSISRIKKSSSNIISIDIGTGVKKLDIDNIFYVESEGHNLNFYTSAGEFTIRARLSDFEQQLSPYNFFRSNKGYLVNLKYVDGVENGACIIAGKQLQISRSRKNDFMSALTDYMAGL